MNKKKVTGIFKLMLIAIVGVSIFALAVYCEDIDTSYKEAEIYIEKENYEKALAKLKHVEEKRFTPGTYRDTAMLIQLCEAHIEYEAGRAGSADWILDELEFEYQTEEQLEKINAFAEQVETAHYDIIHQKLEEERQEYEDSVRYGVPFVGMSEDDISDTTLGSPDDIRHNTATVSGEICQANLYDFKNDGRTIFTARCVAGKVTEVWDRRDEQVNNSSTWSTTNKDKDENKDKEDKYDVYDYTDEEDFYYDNYEDFESYEDAEDYYDEAWDY